MSQIMGKEERNEVLSAIHRYGATRPGTMPGRIFNCAMRFNRYRTRSGEFADHFTTAKDLWDHLSKPGAYGELMETPALGQKAAIILIEVALMEVNGHAQTVYRP